MTWELKITLSRSQVRLEGNADPSLESLARPDGILTENIANASYSCGFLHKDFNFDKPSDKVHIIPGPVPRLPSSIWTVEACAWKATLDCVDCEFQQTIVTGTS